MSKKPHDRNIDLSNLDVFGKELYSTLLRANTRVPFEMLPIQVVFNELKNVNNQDYGDIIPDFAKIKQSNTPNKKP